MVVNDFNIQTFNQDGSDSATIKINNYNPPSLLIQQLPFKEKVKSIEVNRTRNDYIIDTLTSVVICQIVKTGGKVFQIYEGVIYGENFRIIPFRKIMEKLFNLKRRY